MAMVPKKGRPTRAGSEPTDKQEGPPPSTGVDATAFLRPVSLRFLCEVFGKDRSTVKRLIAPVDPVGQERGHDVYNFVDVCPYLCDPVIDVEEYLHNMDHRRMPVRLQKQYWDSQNARLDFEERAGRLFRAEDVAHVNGLAFSVLKTQLDRFPDDIADKFHLSDKIRDGLVERVEGVQRDLHKAMCDMQSYSETKSALTEIESAGNDADGSAI